MSWASTFGQKNPSTKSEVKKKLRQFQRGYVPSQNPFQKHQKKQEEKKKQAQEEAARVYEEFVASFHEQTPAERPVTSFVRGGIIDIDGGKEIKIDAVEYIPQPMFKQSATKQVKLKPKSPQPPTSNKRVFTGLKSGVKSKLRRKKKEKHRNIDSFLDELKQQQATRGLDRPKRPAMDDGLGVGGSYDDGDPLTTNLYVGNLPPNVTELQLLMEFGKYGDVGSVKIMWPRTEEERARGRNCGFVSFMKRDDAAEALEALRGSNIFGQEMRLGWGKRVAIPPHPLPMPKQQSAVSKVDVELPPDAPKLKIKFPDKRETVDMIDCVATYVAREGQVLEQMLWHHERDNPKYRFLFDTETGENLYFRWRTYSMAQGDSLDKWRAEPFQMIIGGPYWIPPSQSTAPKSHKSSKDRHKHKSLSLSDEERDDFEQMLRNLNSSRQKIKQAMGFALDHADKAKEVVEIIVESLSLSETPIPKKIARLFLVSDILHNSSASVKNASAYRSEFQQNLKKIFRYLRETYESVDGRLSADKVKDQVLLVLRVWHAWFLFPVYYLDELEEIFYPKPKTKASLSSKDVDMEDVDGTPLDDMDEASEDVDGMPLDGEADGDIDGIPFDDIDGVPL